MLDFPGKPSPDNPFDVERYRMEFLKHYQRARKWANMGLDQAFPKVWMFGIPPREIRDLTGDSDRNSYVSIDPILPTDPYDLPRLAIKENNELGADIAKSWERQAQKIANDEGWGNYQEYLESYLVKPMVDYCGVKWQEYWRPFLIGSSRKEDGTTGARFMAFTVQDIWLLFPQLGQRGTIPLTLRDHLFRNHGEVGLQIEDDVPFKDADQSVLKAMLFQGLEDKFNQRNLLSPLENRVVAETEDIFSKDYWIYRKKGLDKQVIEENLTPCQRMLGMWIRYFRRAILRMKLGDFAENIGLKSKSYIRLKLWEDTDWYKPTHRQLTILWYWWLNVVVRGDLKWKPLMAFSEEELGVARKRQRDKIKV